jgi:hypothetical protein
MQCNQLIRLIKDWYVHVKVETMAPARMMQFVDKHVSECEICQQDADLQQEVEKIRAFVVPESKIPKAIRIKPDGEGAYISSDEDEDVINDDEDEDVIDDDEDEDVIDDDKDEDEDRTIMTVNNQQLLSVVPKKKQI